MPKVTGPDGKERDMTLEELHMAAINGDEFAIGALGMLYLNGDETTAPDAEKATFWLSMLSKLQRKNNDEFAGADTGSVVCSVEGDQLKCWVQKLTIIKSAIPLDDMKLIFELHNLFSGEYAKADEDDMNVSYAGLYGLEDEAAEARRRLKNAAGVPKLSDADRELTLGELLKKFSNRYGSLEKYFDEDQLDSKFDLQELNYRPVEKSQTCYWIDLTRVTESQYERYANELHHVYNVAELFAPDEFPIDPDDPDTVSVFGTGKFVALADLSYGC